MGVVIAMGAYKWACYGLGSVPTGFALVLTTCPLEGYFHKYDFFLKGGYLGKSACNGLDSMPTKAALALCYLPIGATLALAACLSHGGLVHKCFLDLGCMPLPWLSASLWGLSWPLEHAYGHAMALATCPRGLTLP